LQKIINSNKAGASSTKGKAAAEEGLAEGTGVGDGEGDGEAENEDGAPKKRARKNLGAEDKQDALEALEAEAEAEGEGGGDDDASEMSGMYSDSEDEKEKQKTGKDGESEHGGDAADDEIPKKKDATAMDDSDFEGSDAMEDAPPGPPGATKPLKDKSAKTKRRHAKSALPASHLKAIQDAYGLGKLVHCTGLQNDSSMTIVVHHKYKECPHSLFVGELLHKICRRTRIQDPFCRGVNKVHVKRERSEKPPYDEQVWLECEGINLFALQALGDSVDHRTIYTNDLRPILRNYGVEAARAAVVKEVSSVFGHYGIGVDHRHLSLIADYMVQLGDLRAFNRTGMLNAGSPLQQMSFETTMQFMNTACQDGLSDGMTSPSSSIVLGQLPQVGTGMVNVLADLKPPTPQCKQKRVFKFSS